MAAAPLLLSKKSIDRAGKTVNESQGSAVSAFARRQLEKMGWQEGKGLGKNEDGMASHIKQKKKDDVAGIGADKSTEFVVDSLLKGGAKTSITGGNDNWWHDAFAANLKSMHKTKRDKKDKKDKKKRRTAEVEDNEAEEKRLKKKKSRRSDEEDQVDDDDKNLRCPTMEELFAATGGARLGMRARADQAGKFARSEKEVNTKSLIRAKEEAITNNETKQSEGEGESDADRDRKKQEKKERKEEKKERRKQETG